MVQRLLSRALQQLITLPPLRMGAFGNGERVTLRGALVFFVPAGDQLPDMHEILEDHLVEPSELTSDRLVEVPAASIEQGPYWDMNRCGRPRPRREQNSSCLLASIDSSFSIIFHRKREPG